MTTRRLLAWTAPPVGLGGLALAAKYYVGAPAWAVLLSAVAGVVVSVLPALLPQESEHRRDIWRDWLNHRAHMALLRITASQERPEAAQTPTDHPEQSD